MIDKTLCSECGGHGEHGHGCFTCDNCEGSGFEKGPLGFQEASESAQKCVDDIFDRFAMVVPSTEQTKTPRMIWYGVPFD